MTLRSTKGSTSIFEGGKLKTGIYKIQNIESGTYLDIEVHTRDACCRPAKDLEEGRGLWEIKSIGTGYSTVQVFEPGKPERFCIPTLGSGDSQLVVTVHPVPWRIKVVDDPKYRGFEYIRFSWGTTEFAWEVPSGSKDNGRTVRVVQDNDRLPRRIWRLIPVKVEGALSPSQLSSEILGSGPPLYNVGDATEQSSVNKRVEESEHDDFGTIVTEVTTVTTTTRKRYRVEDT